MFRFIIDLWSNLIYSIRTKLAYRRKMKEIKKRDPYIYK